MLHFCGLYPWFIISYHISRPIIIWFCGPYLLLFLLLSRLGYSTMYCFIPYSQTMSGKVQDLFTNLYKVSLILSEEMSDQEPDMKKLKFLKCCSVEDLECTLCCRLVTIIASKFKNRDKINLNIVEQKLITLNHSCVKCIKVDKTQESFSSGEFIIINVTVLCF